MILQIFNSSNYDDVKFSVIEVVENISCENATLICQPNIKGSNFGGTQRLSSNKSECIQSFTSIENVVWYSFTTDNSANPIAFEIIKTECT